MAKINVAIQNRFFEIIRDRLATILADEIANQAAINYDESLDATVFTDRFIPIDQSEMPCVVVGIAEGEFDNYTQLAKDGNYNFTVDVYHRSPSTDSSRGDQLSNRKLQRLVGVIDYILSDPIYRTLGIQAPSISRVEVQGFQIANPTDEQRSKNISMARMRVRVRANETVAGIEPILLAGYQTNVKIGTTESGYIFSGTAPFTPVPPVCAPANIFNTDKSFDIHVDSGQSYEIPNITVTDSDGSTFEWPAVKDVTCTPPPPCDPVNVSNSDDSYDVNIDSGDSLELPDITVTDSDGTTSQFPSVKDVTCTPSPDTTLQINTTTEGVFDAGETIDVQLSDADGTVTPDSVVVTGSTVAVTLPSPLLSVIPYETGDTISEFTVVADGAGTVTTITTTLTSVAIEVNAVVETVPFTLADGDEVSITYDAAAADGVIKLEGNA